MCMGTRRVRSLSLVLIGAVGGLLLSVGISAVAQRGEPLPLRELQQFANVFGSLAPLLWPFIGVLLALFIFGGLITIFKHYAQR